MKKKEKIYKISNVKKYRGKWIAWHDYKIIASGKTLKEVKKKVKDKIRDKDKVIYESISKHEGMLVV